MNPTSLLPQLKILGFVAIALSLGAVIGFERETSGKPAGFRTHMFVAGAAALLVMLGELLVTRFHEDYANSLIRADPLRIIEAVIVGVSFIGAGTIFRRGGRETVQGLTTAASLLFTASVGICVALAEWWLAAGVTVLALVMLRLLGRWEHHANRNGTAKKQRKP